MTDNNYSLGKHPNSLANLNYRGGRPKTFDSSKKRRSVSVTEEGWEGLQPVIEELGCKSVSDFLEKVVKNTDFWRNGGPKPVGDSDLF